MGALFCCDICSQNTEILHHPGVLTPTGTHWTDRTTQQVHSYIYLVLYFYIYTHKYDLYRHNKIFKVLKTEYTAKTNSIRYKS